MEILPFVKLFAKLSEAKVVFSFLLFGMVLLVTGLTGGYPFTSKLDLLWRLLAVGTGLLLISVAIYGFLHEANTGISTTKTKKRYPHYILDTNDGPPFTMMGSFGKLPPADQVRLFERDETTGLYIPLCPLNYNTENKTWKAIIFNWINGPGKRTLILAWCGPNTKNWVECYEQNLHQTGVSAGIRKMFDDFIPLASREIIVISPIS